MRPLSAAISVPSSSAHEASAATWSALPPSSVQFHATIDASILAPTPSLAGSERYRRRRSSRPTSSSAPKNSAVSSSDSSRRRRSSSPEGSSACARRARTTASCGAVVNSRARTSPSAACARSIGSVSDSYASRRCLIAAGAWTSDAARPSSNCTRVRTSGAGGSSSARASAETALSAAPRFKADCAAARSVSTTDGSPRAGVTSRCAATCSAGAPRSRSTVAACSWRSSRSPGVRSR